MEQNDAKYFIHTYGCQMNIHESENIAGMLMSMGYTQAKDGEKFDIVVFNTCCIRDNAEKKILGHIGAIKALKEKDKSLIVAVVGCMTQQDGLADKLIKRFPFIDIILGTNNINLLPSKIKEIRENNSKIIDINTDTMPQIVEFDGAFRTSGTNAWVNIMYGCNNFCTYCIVPYVRGRERSREPRLIIDEVKSLLAQGYKEITLLGQNVNSYGSNFDDKSINFAYLLNELGKIEGKHRIRFMTSHPKDFTEDIVDIIAKYPTICNYIHLPIQAGSDNVLLAMNRHYTRDYYLGLIDMIRAKIPNCGISTDLMVGFPSESEKDFEDTLDIVQKVKFSTAFTYIYSPRKGTIAATMEQIPYAIKTERIQRLIATQNAITRELSKTFEGDIVEVLCEDTKDDGYVCGRCDNGRLVNFKGDRHMVGNFYNVKISQSKSASLYGEIID